MPAKAAVRRALAPLFLVFLLGSLACKTAGVAHAFMALDSEGGRQRTTFFTDTNQIWCDVQYSSGRTDLTIDVQIRATSLWNDQLQTLVPVDEVIANGEVAGQVGMELVTGFQWTQVDATGSPAPAGMVPYPVGNFVCDVSLDGQPEASLPFAIEYPACPVAPAATGAPCAGWVKSGSACPDAFGNMCVCQEDGWLC
jgi:hypothetical protein